MFYELFYVKSFTTQPGADITHGLVPDGANCGIERVGISYFLHHIIIAIIIASYKTNYKTNAYYFAV